MNFIYFRALYSCSIILHMCVCVSALGEGLSLPLSFSLCVCGDSLPTTAGKTAAGACVFMPKTTSLTFCINTYCVTYPFLSLSPPFLSFSPSLRIQRSKDSSYLVFTALDRFQLLPLSLTLHQRRQPRLQLNLILQSNQQEEEEEEVNKINIIIIITMMLCFGINCFITLYNILTL